MAALKSSVDPEDVVEAKFGVRMRPVAPPKASGAPIELPAPLEANRPEPMRSWLPPVMATPLPLMRTALTVVGDATAELAVSLTLSLAVAPARVLRAVAARIPRVTSYVAK